MEPLSLLLIVAGILFVIGLGWVILKFFFRLLKHFVIAVVLGVLVMLAWYQPWNRAPKNPNLGKLAYGAGSGNFLGRVVAEDADGNYILERGGHQSKYSKSRVVLKER